MFAVAKLSAVQNISNAAAAAAAAAAEKSSLDPALLHNASDSIDYSNATTPSVDKFKNETALETSAEERKRDEVSSDEEKKNERIGKEDNAKELMTDAESRRKEDDDKIVQKVQDKSKPVSSTPVPGTPW